MYTILVTGCAGFIGSHTTEALLARGYKVVGVDNFDPFYPKPVKERNLSGFLNHPEFRFYETDFTERDNLDQLPDDITHVIHLAAKAGVRPSIDDPQGYMKTNLTGTYNILDWMVARGIRKMVFASSSSVYGNNPKLPFSETDNVDNPISPYAFTKKANELMNHTWHHLYGIDIVNLRFFTVYGPRQRPDLAIRKFAQLIKYNKPITMFGDGTTGRDYTFIEDIVAGILSSLDYVVKNDKVFEIFNLGNSSPVSLRELTDTLYRLMGKEKSIIYEPMQPGDVNFTYADISKAERLLGYKPATPLAQGLKKFLEWLESTDK
jgi:UDP-glucuronate 4-epimerase